MTGYVLAHGYCISCGRLFSFNPVRVPSTSAATGKREPICQGCVDKFNVIRKEKGLDLIVPLPDAYGPCDESELQ